MERQKRRCIDPALILTLVSLALLVASKAQSNSDFVGRQNPFGKHFRPVTFQSKLLKENEGNEEPYTEQEDSRRSTVLVEHGAFSKMSSLTYNKEANAEPLRELQNTYGVESLGNVRNTTQSNGNRHNQKVDNKTHLTLSTVTTRASSDQSSIFHDDLKLSESAEEHRVTVRNCMNNTTTIYGSEGIVWGLDSRSDNPFSPTPVLKLCGFRIIAPRGRHLILTMEALGPQGPCSSGTVLFLTPPNAERLESLFELNCIGRFDMSPVFFIPSNIAEFKMINTSYRIANLANFEEIRREVPTLLPKFKIVFKTTLEAQWTKLTPVFTSPTSGSITQPGFDLRRPCSPLLDAVYNLTVPDNYAVMISFTHFDLSLNHFLKLSVVNRDGAMTSERQHTGDKYIPVDIYFSVATLVLEFNSMWLGHVSDKDSGMNMSFSFYPELEAPRKLNSDLFDCSEPAVYARFQHHVHCNLQRECQGGEDEGPHCPFSSTACNGSIDAGNKCFISVESRTALTWEAAREECRSKGGDLAMMKTQNEYEALWNIYSYGRKQECAYVGLELRQARSNPLYRRTWAWADGTTAFDVNVTSRVFIKMASLVVIATNRMLIAQDAASPGCSRFICQVQYQDTEPLNLPVLNSIPLAKSTLNFKGIELVRCSAGHFTHNFLRCYSGSQCGAQAKQPRCSLPHAAGGSGSAAKSVEIVPSESVAMFSCDNDRQSVPYNVVCDFMSDCPDDSDETLCRHEACSGTYQCGNGQCVPLSRHCDLYVDCLDGSDEDMCISGEILRNAYDFIYQYKLPPPTVINLDKEGFYEQTSLAPSQPCPERYFRCWGSHRTSHCLPGYLLCNGVTDCASGEDELGCDSYTCPGLYRCRDSSVCVHVDQVCDGVTQCPKQDDELLCEATCPPQCVCQGLAFICHQPFPAHSFPSLRYLDASHSGMNLADLASNFYLVHLNLEFCDINNIQEINVPNLRHIDLSNNELSSMDMDVFLAFQNLQTLILRGNPLTSLTGGASDKRQYWLESLDLTYSRLPLLSSSPFKLFFSLQTINVSFSRVRILTESFQSIPTLAELDLRGNPVSSYPQDVFKAMTNLRVIYVDNYKLCCPGMLPEGFETDFCFAPEDEISSCADLLRADSYRAFLWFICVASIMGNVCCFLSRNWFHKSQSASGFNTFVSNLSMADCLMGVYLAFIGGADHVYRGSYYQYEQDWASSVPCSIAGFLSLLSNEVSAITICLITLDRFIVLRFPFSRWKFHRKSANVACAVTWCLGIVLGLAPLLVPHWQFYSQTGICVPLPVTRQEFKGHGYSFGVMIVFNFLLFLLIAGGQVSIYLSVQANTMTVDTNRKLQDMTIARRLITVAVSDFFCWFPIGLLGLLAKGDVPIPGEVNVALAIFVLPLNSALNPFLYTFNMMVEKRRKREERRLLEWLEKNGDDPLAASTAGTSVSRSVERTGDEACRASDDKNDAALRCLSTALESQLVSCDEVRSFLSTMRGRADR